ncbi:autotransporter outer membrane beta-barrel domain-containing protein [Achromobacter deleyi]|uniref:autotransporter family protein n=1 Tax=Achromobacter deleyi TaxID=1353891 RepID=UPI001F2920F8|nr:autotransporter outer membrane beta-barrel domain-containing protein [Achromobacter deleyi]UIP23749.1 autotransporter outer membrane beta-barrel domain-containing protein [Achromobacter deleyi]
MSATFAASAIQLAPQQAGAQQLVANGTTQTTVGNYASAAPGSGLTGSALLAINNGAINSATPLTLSSSGTPSPFRLGPFAAYAANGGQITIAGGSTVTAINTSGLVADGIGASITATNIALTASSTALGVSAGALADNGATIRLDGGSVRYIGPVWDAIRVDNNGRLVTSNTLVAAEGAGAVGINVRAAGGPANVEAVLTNTTISQSGNFGTGILSASGGTVVMDGGSVSTSGDGSRGIYAALPDLRSGMLAPNFTATNVRIETFGNDRANGISSEAGAQVLVNGGSVTTHGVDSHGLFLAYSDNSTGTAIPAAITLNGTSVVTHGASAHGAFLLPGTQLIANNSTIAAHGVGAAGLAAQFNDAPAIARLTNTAVTSDQGPGIVSTGAALDVTADRSSISGKAALFDVGGSGSTLNLLANASTLTGAGLTNAAGISNVALNGASTWNVTGDSVVTKLSNNDSLVAFAAPAGDPSQPASYKTLTTQNYSGANGRIGLNAFLGADGSPSDRLVINGGTASGATSLLVTPSGGAGALTVGDGVLVVNAINGATTAPTAFSLGNRVAAGAYEYQLFHGGRPDTGGNPDDQNWYLRSTVDPTPEPPVNPPTPGEPDNEVPNYRREVPVDMAVPALASRLGLAMLGTYHDRAGEDYLLSGSSAHERPAAWGRVFGEDGSVSYGGRNAFARVGNFERHGPSYSYDLGGLQLGVDLYRKLNDDGSRNTAGVFLGAGRIEADVDAALGGKAGTTRMSGYSVGAYGTRKGSSGWYLDAVAQGTRYDDIQARARYGETLKTDGYGFAASLEGGYPIALSGGWAIEPQAQLVYQHLSFGKRERDSYGLIGFDDSNSLYGRLGGRISKNWDTESGRPTTIWARANVWDSFGARSKTTFAALDGANPVSLSTDLGGSWAQVGVGVSGQIAKNLTAFASGDYNFAIDQGRGTSVSGRVGIRMTW